MFVRVSEPYGLQTIAITTLIRCEYHLCHIECVCVDNWGSPKMHIMYALYTQCGCALFSIIVSTFTWKLFFAVLYTIYIVQYGMYKICIRLIPVETEILLLFAIDNKHNGLCTMRHRDLSYNFWWWPVAADGRTAKHKKSIMAICTSD